MTDWKAEAFLWERRTSALRGIVDMLLDANQHAARTSTDPAGCLLRLEKIAECFENIRKAESLVGPVGSGEFRSRILGAMEARFETVRAAFNEEIRRRGIELSPGDVLGEAKKPPAAPLPAMPPWSPEKAEQLADYLLEIYAATTDQDPNDVLLRALGVYRSFVVHARGGGQVRFVKDGEKDRTLKVRLR